MPTLYIQYHPLQQPLANTPAHHHHQPHLATTLSGVQYRLLEISKQFVSVKSITNYDFDASRDNKMRPFRVDTVAIAGLVGLSF
jgi:hypothetical protein